MLGAVLLSGHAAAQGSLADVLTGGSSRAWQGQPLTFSAGLGSACLTGETFTFAVTHQVIVSRCVEGRIMQREQAWSAEGAVVVIAGLGAYQATMTGTRRIRLLALSQARPANDIDLSLNED